MRETKHPHDGQKPKEIEILNMVDYISAIGRRKTSIARCLYESR